MATFRRFGIIDNRLPKGEQEIEILLNLDHIIAIELQDGVTGITLTSGTALISSVEYKYLVDGIPNSYDLISK